MGKLKPVTPGELLREEFLIPMGLTQYRLAKEIGVPAQRIGDIVGASVPSRRTPTCACAGSSVFPTAIGCGRRRPMILRWRKSPRQDLGEDQTVGGSVHTCGFSGLTVALSRASLILTEQGYA
jgi:hypothetical protein